MRMPHVSVQIISGLGVSDFVTLYECCNIVIPYQIIQCFCRKGISVPLLAIQITSGDLLRVTEFATRCSLQNTFNPKLYLRNSLYSGHLFRKSQFCSLLSLEKARKIGDQYLYLAVL